MNPQRPRDWSTARQRASDPAGARAGATFAVRRYALHSEIGSGSVATVHLGRFGGDDFAHTVAIKRLWPQFAKDLELVSMLVAGARLAAKVRHSNVVPTLDVVAGTELLVVMEYVQGESLATLLRTLRGRDAQAPLPIVSGVFVGVLNGLHAVHGARGASPEGTAIGDQDVPPHDVLVGTDGVARLIDLGIGRGRAETSDLFAASVMLWEALAGRPLPPRTSPEGFDPPSRYRAELTPEIDAILSKGLARPPAPRFATASEMALALEAAVTPATQSQIGRWVESLAGPALEERARLAAELENAATRSTADTLPEVPSHEQSAAAPVLAATTSPTPTPTPTPASADQHGAVTRRERVRSVHAFETKRGLGPVDAGPAAVETSRRRSSDDLSLPRKSRVTVLVGLAAAVLLAAIGVRSLVVGPRDAASIALPASTQEATAHEGAAPQTATRETAARAPTDVASPADPVAVMPQRTAAVAPPSPVEAPQATTRSARPRRSLKPARDEAPPRTKRDDVL